MPKPFRRILVVAALAIVAVALIQVYTSRRDNEGAVAPAAGGRAAVPVLTALVESKPLAVTVEALGTARANEAIEVTSRASNVITALRFEEGQQVRAGQVLVELDSAQARADLAAAAAALSESRSAFTRSRDLYTQQALSQAQLEQIEATLKANEARVAASEARLADTIIRAPFSGRVGLRRVSLGSLISPGAVITTLDDTRTMKLDFEVPEAYLAVLEPGLEVRATSVAYPDRVFEGRVQSVDSRVDPVTRTVRVRAQLPNDDNALKPGMFMTVALRREPRPGIVVPEQALVPERGKVFVFLVRDGVVARREVITGRRVPGEVEIVSGVEAGDRLIVEGTQKVRDGTPVVEAPALPTTGEAPQ